MHEGGRITLAVVREDIQTEVICLEFHDGSKKGIITLIFRFRVVFFSFKTSKPCFLFPAQGTVDQAFLPSIPLCTAMYHP
jgi:hypothetical protein